MLLHRPLGLDGVIWAVDIGWFIGLIYTALTVRPYLQDPQQILPGNPHDALTDHKAENARHR